MLLQKGRADDGTIYELRQFGKCVEVHLKLGCGGDFSFPVSNTSPEAVAKVKKQLRECSTDQELLDVLERLSYSPA